MEPVNKNKTVIPWLEQGYETFAESGPNALKVERLSKQVGKNKSSFYHHFADTEIFISWLLEMHLAQAKLLAEKESKANSVPDLVNIIIEHKTDLLFNRQLRVHRENPEYEACFCKVNEITLPGFLPVWTRILKLEDQPHLAGLVFKLSIENFFLQITKETLNESWLNKYFEDLQLLVNGFKMSASTQD